MSRTVVQAKHACHATSHFVSVCCIVQSVLSWQRARAASLLAANGHAWTSVIAQHNSGTGNNQWMVRGTGWLGGQVSGWLA